MRLQYTPNIRIIEITCSGSIDERVILNAFECGVDGVFVAGCEVGGCHFLNGNIQAGKRVNAVKKLLDDIGLGGERLEMFNLSSAQAGRFAEIANEMNERIKLMGPNPLTKSDSGCNCGCLNEGGV